MAYIELTPSGKKVFQVLQNFAEKFTKDIDPNPAETFNNISTYNLTPATKKVYDKADELDLQFDGKNYTSTANSAVSAKNGSGYSGYSGISASSATKGSSGISSDMKAYIDYVTAMTDKNNAWNAEQAQKQMDFQERMRNTQYQAAVADLKAAGLNPVLAAGSGAQAAAPSGSSASADTSNSQMMAQLALSAIEGLTTSAVSLANGYNSVKKVEEKEGNSTLEKIGNFIGNKVIPQIITQGIKTLLK